MEARALALKLATRHGTRNPFHIADELGCITVFAPLVDIRGFHQHVKRRNIIYINDSLDARQQSLVCAHELAHLLLHRGMNRIFMDHHTQIVTQKFENEAHQFSLELLYSDEALLPFLGRPIPDAAAFMGVPEPLAQYRMNTVQPTLWPAEFDF